MKQKFSPTSFRSLFQYVGLFVLLLTGTQTMRADKILDDANFHAYSYNDHVRFEVMLCDLWSKDTYSKGGYIYASGSGGSDPHHQLIYLEYDYDEDDNGKYTTGRVKAKLVNPNGRAWFSDGQEITTTLTTFSLSKWSNDNDYLTAYIDYYYPAELAGKTYHVHYNYDHSNGDHHWMVMNSSCTFQRDLGLTGFDTSKFTCERTSPDKIKFTVPMVPTFTGKANDVRTRFCTYDVTYTFYKQDGTTQKVTENIECKTGEQVSKETTIPAAIGNPKQIDVSVAARQGMKDKSGEFWSQTDKYVQERYFKVVSPPSDLKVGYRQFDATADLSWAQSVDSKTYLTSTPYVYRIETDAKGVPLSGSSWNKRGTLDHAQSKTSLSYSDNSALLGHYYKYLVINVPDDWINHGVTSTTLNSPSDEFVSRIGGVTSDVLSTQPKVEIYDLQQDTTVLNKVRLTWRYSRVPVSSSTVKFTVLRKKPAETAWSILKDNITADANPAANSVLEIEDEDLSDVTTRYDYMVRLSINSDKYTFESNKVTAGLLRGTLLRAFEASKGTHEKSVVLNWRSDLAGSSDDTYVISRRYAESDNEFQQITTQGNKISLGSYTDGDAWPGYYYEYKLEVYSGNVLQNTLYDIGFTQSRGAISGTVTFASEGKSNAPVEDVRISLQASGTDNTVVGHSLRVDGASTGVSWETDSTALAKLFGNDYTVQMFARPDSTLTEGAVLAEIPGEGRLVVGKQTDGEYELMLQKVTGYVQPVVVGPTKVEPILPVSTKTTDLSTITDNYVAQNAETLTGKLNSLCKISIADGATVYLKDVTIDGTGEDYNYSAQWAGITCPGDATLVLEGDNYVKGYFHSFPGIEIAKDKTLTIKGTGSLTASSNLIGAGIGGAYGFACGNINIEGGTINATGGQPNVTSTYNYGPGIGSPVNGCGYITISGGKVNAVTNAVYSAAIGTHRNNTGSVGAITITNTVSEVTASGSGSSINPNGSKKGGTVTIGGTVYWDGSTYQNNGENFLAQNPLTYTGNGLWTEAFKRDKEGYSIPGYTIPGRFTYGTATAIGVKLPANTYSLLTVTKTGNNLQFQVNNGDVKKLTATKYKYLAPFHVGGADSITTAQGFKGYFAEVRVWDHALTDKEKTSYNDRILSGRESGLAIYWPLDEGLDHYAFDASVVNDLPNGRHATVGGNISSSTILPTREQLSRYGLTGSDGTYYIRSIPFAGSATTYTVTPTKGIHQFSPASRTGFIGSTALTLNNYDFTDESSFPMRGTVTYLNTNIPVDSVQFKIDGVLVQDTDGPRMTDSNGQYEIAVPIGSHRIEAYRQGHRLTGFPIDGGTWDFKQSETVNFVDSTLVNVTGRINGGFTDKDAPVGFAQSVNRIGQATITLSLGKDTQCSFNYITDDKGNREFGTTDLPVESATTEIKSTAYRAGLKTDNTDTYYINIKTDPQTGEFSALLPPLKYKVESITFAGNDNPYNRAEVFANNLPLLDATTAMKEKMKCDTLAGTGLTYQYSAKMIRQYRSTPTIHVAQTGLREGAFGERKVIVNNVDETTDSLEVLTLTADSHSYRFGYPIFRQGRDYNLGIDVAEEYKNYDTGEEFKEIPQDALIHIVNEASNLTTVFGEKGKINGEEISMGMPYKTYVIEVTPDKSGHVDYTFEAGWPNFAEGHLLNMSVSAIVDGRTTMWKPTSKRTALDLIVLGSMTTGTNFVTEGPDIVDMVLRRPPGSTSVASFEETTIKSYVKTSTNGVSKGSETGAYISEAPSFEFTKGSVLGIAVLTNSTIKTVIDQKITANDSYSDSWVNGSDTTYTVTSERATPSEMQYINEHEAFEPEGGDTYIGRSTNLLYSKGLLLDVFKTDKGYEITDRDGITVGQRFGTSFTYPQAYILNVLIPGWEKIIKSKLQEGYIDADHTDSLNCPRVDGKVIYYTKYKPGDEKFGTGNADLSVWTTEEITAAGGCPSYRMRNGTGQQADDEVQNAINQIKIWRERIADNEREKVEAINGGATLLDNYSFSSTKVSQKTSVSTSSVKGYTHSTNYSMNGESHWGALFNNAGAYIIHNLSESTTTSEKKDTTTVNTRTVAWTMSDADYRTALSVDVYDSKNGWGPIFITRGGQTANPYEGETQTMFYEKGTKLNEATMRVEVPQLRVDGSTEITDVPTGTQAQFKLELSNLSETNDICTYVLEVKEGSNPNGAILTVDGNILSNGKDGRTVKLKGKETIEKTLVVSQSDKNIIDYNDIVLVLKSQNDVACSSEPVKLRVHFVPSSSPVDLSVDHTVLNKSSLDKYNGVTATMFNLDRQSDDLHGLRLRYRRKGEDKWTVHTEWTTIDTLVTNTILAMPDSIYINEKISFTTDGIYEVQAQTYGLYGKEEVTFESNIIEVTQDTHGPKTLGMVYPEDGQLTYLNRNNMHVRFNEVLNSNALSASENFRIEGGMNNVVYGDGQYPDVAVQLNGNRIETEAIYDLSNSDYAFDMWFYRQGDGTIISLGTEDNLLSLSTHDDGKLRARIGSEADVYETDSVLPKDKWIYMALNYKRKTSNDPQNRITMLYVIADDKSPKYVGNPEMPANDLDGHGKLAIGGDGMKGMIAELSIWNNNVSALDLYNSRTTARASYTPGLVGYWNMTEGHGTQITDMARSRHMYMESESWYINNKNRAAHLDGGEKSPLKVDIQTFNPTSNDNFAYEMWFRGTEADNPDASMLMFVSHGYTGELREEYKDTVMIGDKIFIYNRYEHQVRLHTGIGFANGKLMLRQFESLYSTRYPYLLGKAGSPVKVGESNPEAKKDIVLSEENYLDGNWHHLALNIRRGTSAIVYVDGEAVKVLPETSVPGITSNYLTVGGVLNSDLSTTNRFKGDVDEIRIWNAALDGGLIKDRRFERMDNNYPGLVGYFPMEEIHRTAQANVVTDFSLDNFGENTSFLKLVRDSVVVDGVKVPAITQATNAPALKPGSTKLRLTDTQFYFTASDDEIYFSFPDSSLPLMDGNDYVATISYIKDEHGNNSEPVQWKFHADFAALEWNLEELTFSKAWNEPAVWEQYINNLTGEAQTYEISGLPSWMTVDKPVGTITGYGGHITFNMGADVPIGRHTEYIYLTDRLGIRRVLPITVIVKGDEPDWYVNPDLYESNMMMTGQIYIGDKISEYTDSKIAAFDAMGLCRGVASPEYVSTRDAYYVNMIVYGGSSTDLSSGETDLTFKMYDASTGITYPIVNVTLPNKETSTTVRYAPDAIYGSYDKPVVFSTTDLLQQTITLPMGWSWMSIYVQPESTDISNVLPKSKSERKKFMNIKGHNAIASINQSDATVLGSLKEMTAGNMYKIQVSSRVNYNLIGSFINARNTEATIYSGWNWIGTLSNSVMSVKEAFAELDPEPGDVVKTRTAFASYRGNGVWEGNLQNIVPGQGYVYNSQATTTKTFHYPQTTGGYQSMAKEIFIDNEIPRTSHYEPTEPHRYPDNMNVIAVVKKDGAEAVTAEIGAFVNGECRGVAEYDNGYYFLTILGSAADDIDNNVEIRVYLDGDEYAVEHMPFTSDAIYGSLETPHVLDIDATGIRAIGYDDEEDDAEWYTVQGQKIGRKPKQQGIYIHRGQKVTIKLKGK